MTTIPENWGETYAMDALDPPVFLLHPGLHDPKDERGIPSYWELVTGKDENFRTRALAGEFPMADLCITYSSTEGLLDDAFPFGWMPGRFFARVVGSEEGWKEVTSQVVIDAPKAFAAMKPYVAIPYGTIRRRAIARARKLSGACINELAHAVERAAAVVTIHDSRGCLDYCRACAVERLTKQSIVLIGECECTRASGS